MNRQHQPEDGPDPLLKVCIVQLHWCYRPGWGVESRVVWCRDCLSAPCGKHDSQRNQPEQEMGKNPAVLRKNKSRLRRGRGESISSQLPILLHAHITPIAGFKCHPPAVPFYFKHGVGRTVGEGEISEREVQSLASLILLGFRVEQKPVLHRSTHYQ